VQKRFQPGEWEFANSAKSWSKTPKVFLQTSTTDRAFCQDRIRKYPSPWISKLACAQVQWIRRKQVLNQNRPILFIQKPWADAIPYFVERIQQSGLQVVRTFDLHETGVEEATCTCQNHGTEKCDCQMMVLLIYGKEKTPASLVAHGHNGQTWFSMVEFLGGTNARLEAQVRDIFALSDGTITSGEVL
jgi:hypothetical protein